MESKIMRAYRLCAPQWVPTALSGEGSRRVGGRWNSPGTPAVYLGESRALTALEMLVHLPSPLSRQKEFALLEVSFPADLVKSPKVTSLIPDWAAEPPTRGSVSQGDEWLQSRKHLAYRLPSAIIPDETIFLLNPAHESFAQVRLESQRPFFFDSRLAK